MNLRWLGLFIMLPFIGGCSTGGIEKIDVYKMFVKGTPLFGKMDRFINAMGLPEKIKIGTNKTYTVESIEDMITILQDNKKDDYGVMLYYNGIEMDLWKNKTIIPMAIDFRGSDIKITYKNIILDNTFALDQFKEQFPKSYALSENGLFDHVTSLFETATQQNGTQYKHYILERRTKTRIFATTTVEFTFENDTLIYIFFANWD